MKQQMQPLKAKLARKILAVIEPEDTKDKVKQNSGITLNSPLSRSFETGATQDYIPIKNISDGIIATADGRFVSFIEILPVNFYKKPDIAKKRILTNFKSLFANGPRKLQLKIMNDFSNPTMLIGNIERECLNKSDLAVKKSLNEYIQWLHVMGNTNSVVTRYFLIFECEERSNDFKEIKNSMDLSRRYYINTLESCGNICVTSDNIDIQTAEFLHYFFNRNSSRFESLQNRMSRMKADYDEFSAQTKKNKNLTMSDLVAPRGLDTTNRNYVFMDGYYYGFLGIPTKSYPGEVLATWINLLNFGPQTDIDIIFNLINKESTVTYLKGVTHIEMRNIQAKSGEGDIKKVQKYTEAFQNNSLILQSLQNGDNLYDVAIIITMRADTARELGNMRRAIQKQLMSYQMDTDECFLCAEDYLYLTMPFLMITAPFRRLKHNMLTSSIESLYPFTSYQVSELIGIALGLNRDSKSLFIFNNFNNKRYSNGNIFINGRSGAGKTFTESLMLTRMFYSGITCFCIIPKKGFDYIRPCKMLNGAYIPLSPGAKARINIMEIRPEGEIDLAAVNTDDVIINADSLLSKKISSITTWLTMRVGHPLSNKQENLVNKYLTELYEKYGITEDNTSIFKDHAHTKLKKMPIISDMYTIFQRDEELSDVVDALYQFVEGRFKNFDGQTNVDINNHLIVFDVNEDTIGPKDHASILYIAFDFVYDRVRSGTLGRSAIFFDEVWKMMTTKESAEQVRDMIKLVRGYNSCTVMSTQEIEDFLNSAGGLGVSIINNSAIKIILAMEEEGLRKLQNTVRISPEEFENILAFKKGDALFISGTDHFEINITPSEYEFECLKDKTS